jgi:hypothetical protein
VAWSGAGLECLGEVSEDEADAIIGEEQVGGELGARGPLLLPLLILILGARVPLGWRWPGLGVGVGGGEAGGVGSLVGGGGWCGRAVAGPMARAAALEAASGRRRSHGWGGSI